MREQGFAGQAAENHGRQREPAAAEARRCLRLHILGSGSKGNCALVEGPVGMVMIDCGFSRRETLRRMGELGVDPERIAALILTHEHGDHVGGVSVWCKRWEGRLLASRGTAGAKSYLDCLGFEEFAPGDTLEVAGMRMQTFATSHDVVNPVGFRFECDGDAIGYVTDTGMLSSSAMDALRDARILAIESNHDVPMLRCGDYPRALQDRILSDHGHLSNEQAAAALPQLTTGRTEQVVVMHISQENNRLSLADNGSVTVVTYEDGQFSIEVIGDRSYRQKGAEQLKRKMNQ